MALLLLCALALALGPSAGQGHEVAPLLGTEVPNVRVVFSCTGVTYTYTGFPNAPENTVREGVFLQGHRIANTKFTFDGPTASNTLPIIVPPEQHYGIDARVMWTRRLTNGVRGGRDVPRGGGIKCPPAPAFTISKLQEIAGSGAGFTSTDLNGKVGQAVLYELIVHNTGNTSLSFSSLSDSHCDAGTIAGGPVGSLAAGASAIYTCAHVLTAADQSAGSYSNTAGDIGRPPVGQGSPITHSSNTVLVNVSPPTEPSPPHQPPASTPPPSTPPARTLSAPAAPLAAVTPKAQVLSQAGRAPLLVGPQGCVRGNFVVRLKAANIASVTFYLDGHRLRKLKAKRAHVGSFSISIRAATLRVGVHWLVAKIRMAGKPRVSSRRLVIVRCASHTITPRFTG